MNEPVCNPMPDKVRAQALAAQQRLQKSLVAPMVGEIWTRSEDGGRDYLACPWDASDWELWVCLLLDAFGTRHLAVASAFMRQLGAFCPEIFDGERRSFVLDGELFQQALAIVRSLKPRNEAEAGIAVQAVAVHFCSMKVAANLENQRGLDSRTAASLAALTKAYAGQIRALREMRDGNRAKRQVIKVEKHVHLHDEKHVHLPSGGASNSNGQPHATRAQRAGATPAGGPVQVAALPSPDKSGEAVSRSGCEGQAGVPDARGREAVGGAEREA